MSTQRLLSARERSKHIKRGKAFELALIKSLEHIPYSFTTRLPGKVIYRRKGGARALPAKIDLFFCWKDIYCKIECKSTEATSLNIKSVVTPTQREALLEFNARGRRFFGLLAVQFYTLKKVVFVDCRDFEKVKTVRPEMPGVVRARGVWELRDTFVTLRRRVKVRRQRVRAA